MFVTLENCYLFGLSKGSEGRHILLMYVVVNAYKWGWRDMPCDGYILLFSCGGASLRLAFE